MNSNDALIRLIQDLRQNSQDDTDPSNVVLQQFQSPYEENLIQELVTMNKWATLSQWLGKGLTLFTRSSQAYDSSGNLVSVNTPRFTTGVFGKGVYLEEGTTNLVSSNSANGISGLPSNLSAKSVNTYVTNFGFTDNYSVKSTQVLDNADNAGFYTPVCVVNPNTQYTASCYVYTSIPNKKFVALIGWYDSSNAFVSSSVGTATTIPTNTWTRLTVTGTAPSNAPIARVGSVESVTRSNTGDVYYFDDVMLEQKPYATSFIDGTRQPDLLQIPSSIIDVTKPFTIECYGQSNTFGNYRMIFDAWSRFYVALSETNNVVFAYTDEGGTQKSIWSSSKIPNPNGMHYWTYVFDGNNHKVYVDGVKHIDTVAISMKPMPQYLRIGTWLAYPWNGIIDNFRISNIARTDTEITNATMATSALVVDSNTIYKLDFEDDVLDSVSNTPSFYWNQGGQYAQKMEVIKCLMLI